MNLIETLNWRYATKTFDPTQKLSDDQLFQLTESLRLAPSSFGLQPWKFLVVTNPVVREELV
jgi:nitroreductase